MSCLWLKESAIISCQAVITKTTSWFFWCAFSCESFLPITHLFMLSVALWAEKVSLKTHPVGIQWWKRLHEHWHTSSGDYNNVQEHILLPKPWALVCVITIHIHVKKAEQAGKRDDFILVLFFSFQAGWWKTQALNIQYMDCKLPDTIFV